MSDVPSPPGCGSVTERDFVALLIELYRDCPELWKVKDKDYTNKIKRSLALQKILNVLKKSKPDFTEEKLKKKINILRTNFNKQCQKLDLKTRSGASSDDMPEPTLWYYEDLLFIKDQVETRASIKCEPLLIEEPPKPSTVHTTPPTPKKRKSTSNTTKEEHVDLAPTHSRKPDNEADILAKCWAIKLNRLAPDQRLYAEKIINDTLFEAEMGTLTRNGVSFLSLPTSHAPSMSYMTPYTTSQRFSQSVPNSSPSAISSPAQSPSPAPYTMSPDSQNSKQIEGEQLYRRDHGHRHNDKSSSNATSYHRRKRTK